MTELDRADILDKTSYQFNMDASKSGTGSKKSWWVIGLLIGLTMNFIAFVLFYFFHKREYLKKTAYKNAS